MSARSVVADIGRLIVATIAKWRNSMWIARGSAHSGGRVVGDAIRFALNPWAIATLATDAPARHWPRMVRFSCCP